MTPALPASDPPPWDVAEPAPATAAKSEPAPVATRAPAPAPVADEAAWNDEPSWVRDEADADAPALAKADAEALQAQPPQPAGEPAQAPSRVAQITFDRTPQQDRWMAVVETLFERASVAGLVRELAWQAQCTGCDEVDGQTVWRLKVERESLRQTSHRDRLQAALSALLDRPQRIEVEAGVAVDSAARRDLAAKARRQAEAEDLIHADPVVRQLLATFPSARIVPGSIRPR
jgi:DNA polymerase-3 subunit gamma/tau